MKKNSDGCIKKSGIEEKFDKIVDKRIEARSCRNKEFIEETQKEFNKCLSDYLKDVKRRNIKKTKEYMKEICGE